ncbi:MAG: PA14 domain-containing protein, partial [Armatimonadota bacterium]
MKRRSGSILYYVTAMAALLCLAVVGVLRLSNTADAQVSRIEDNGRIEAAFNATMAPIRDLARRRSLTLPYSSSYTSSDGVAVTATTVDTSATVAKSARTDMVATRDGKTFRRTEYVGISTPPVTGPVATGLMGQSGYWPSYSFPYTYNSTSYYAAEGGPQQMPSYYGRFNTINWLNQSTTAVNPNGIEGFWYNFQGQVKGPISGTVNFTVQTDDGCRLYVDGQLIINQWAA